MNFFGHLIPPLLVVWDFIKPWTKFSKISFKAYWEHQTFSSSPLGTLWKPHMAKMDFCRLFGASFPTLSATYQSLVGSCQTLNIFFSKSPAKPIGLVWLSLDIFSEAKKKFKAPLQFFGASDPKLIQVNPEAFGFPLCARWIKWMCPLGSFDAFDHVYDFTPNLWGIPSNLLWTRWHSMDTPSTAGRRGLYLQLPYIHENFFDFFLQNFFLFRFRSTKVFHWICLASCPCNLSGGLWVSWTPLFPLTCWLFHLLPNNHIWLID